MGSRQAQIPGEARSAELARRARRDGGPAGKDPRDCLREELAGALSLSGRTSALGPRTCTAIEGCHAEASVCHQRAARGHSGRVPNPFHLYDEAEIRRRAAELNAAFAWNPGFKEYFAVKATPNPEILRILAECGCGCDCATGVELLLADLAGVTGRDIMLSSNDTPDEDFRAADERGAIINLDAYDMVACLQRALGGRVPHTVCCRVNPGGAFESENGIIGSPEDSKFGMTPTQLEQAFRELAALGVEEFGIHAFLASNTQVNDYYPRLARQLFEMAADLSARLGVHIGFIDLSGGIGVAYHPDDTPATWPSLVRACARRTRTCSCPRAWATWRSSLSWVAGCSLRLAHL